MLRMIEQLLGAMEDGRITRREAVTRLVAVVAAAGGFAAGSGAEGAEESSKGQAPPTFHSKGLNHVALRVTDLARSREFYRRHLGLRVISRSQWNTFMACGKNNFVAMFKADRAGLDHFAFTVDNYDAGKSVTRGDGAGLSMRRHDDRVYFDDPDGIELQISGEWDDYPG